MRWPIVPNDARPVQREHDVRLLQAYIVEYLIVGPLDERGVDRGYWFEARKPKSPREDQGMLFRDADVVEPFRESLLKLVKTSPLRHRRRYRYDALVLFGEFKHCITEHRGVRPLMRRLWLAGLYVEARSAVESSRS